MNRVTIILIIYLLIPSSLFPQSNKVKKIGLENLEREIDYTVLTGFGLANAVSLSVINNYNDKTFWRTPNSFHTSNYFNKFFLMDKLGHFYSSNLLLHIFSASLEGTNMEIEQTFLYGGLLSLMVQTYGEYRDGKSSGRGFNYGDFAFDVLGTGFAVAQYYVPYLKNIQPRFSYSMSDSYLKSNKNSRNVFNDYEGQIYWLAFKINSMLPDNLEKYWPDWLMLSVGYGVSGLNMQNEAKEIYIAFDIDAEKVIPYRTPVWQFFINTINYFHFPMPGIMIKNNKVQLSFGYKGLF